MKHEMGGGEKAGWKSWFWMVLCCVPMIAIIVLIVLAKRSSP